MGQQESRRAAQAVPNWESGWSSTSGVHPVARLRDVSKKPCSLALNARRAGHPLFVCGGGCIFGIHFAFIASSDSIDSMATLTIRQLDEKTKTRLRVRAAHHGRSMEEEAREILRSALTAASPVKGNLAEAIHRRFAALGGHELELPRRDPMRRAPEFGE